MYWLHVLLVYPLVIHQNLFCPTFTNKVVKISYKIINNKEGMREQVSGWNAGNHSLFGR